MARLPRRFLPGRLYEITHRTFQARYFFIPSKQLNAIIIGALAFAAEQYGLRFCYTVWMTNHCHHLIRADNAKQVARTFKLANQKIAIEVQKLCASAGMPWEGGVFTKTRASAVEVVGGRDIQLARLEYLMSQGVKEGLVPHVTKWPGVQSASAWLSGSMRLDGVWIDRTDLYEVERGVSRRKKKVTRKWLTQQKRKECEHKVSLSLFPLPFMDEMKPEERQAIANEACGRILAKHQYSVKAVRRDWKKRLCDRSMFTYRPESAKRDVVPEVHAESKEAWRLWKIEWDDWLNFYERASERFRSGIAEALHEFPEGCFVPTGVFALGAVGRPPPVGSPA